MTEPQVWTMIAVFATLMFGMLTVVSTLFVNVLKAQIAGVTAEIGGVRTEITRLDERIDGLRSEVRSEIGGIHDRLDNLDRDVQALVKHIFGLDRG